MMNKVNNTYSSNSNYLHNMYSKIAQKIEPLLGFKTDFALEIGSRLYNDLPSKIYDRIGGNYLNMQMLDDAIKKNYYRELLRTYLGNVKKTAQIAGVSREHLQRKLVKYGIDVNDFRIEAYKNKKHTIEFFEERYIEKVFTECLANLEDKLNPVIYNKLESKKKELSKEITDELNVCINPDDIYKKSLKEVFNEVKKRILTDIYNKTGFDTKKMAQYFGTSENTIKRQLERYGVTKYEAKKPETPKLEEKITTIENKIKTSNEKPEVTSNLKGNSNEKPEKSTTIVDLLKEKGKIVESIKKNKKR